MKRNLGIDISQHEIERILRRLGFGVSRQVSETIVVPRLRSAPLGMTNQPVEFSVQMPTWRLDVEREIDLLEELARIYGYNRFPNTLPAFVGAVVELPDEPKNAKVRETMLALGYDESISITFISEPDAKIFGDSHSSKNSLSGAPDALRGAPAEPLALANPLSDEAGYMRTSLLPGLLNLVSYNLNRGTTDCSYSKQARSSRSGPIDMTSAGTSDSWPPAMFYQERSLCCAALHVLPHEGRHRRIAGCLSTSVAAVRHDGSAVLASWPLGSRGDGRRDGGGFRAVASRAGGLT